MELWRRKKPLVIDMFLLSIEKLIPNSSGGGVSGLSSSEYSESEGTLRVEFKGMCAIVKPGDLVITGETSSSCVTIISGTQLEALRNS